MTKSFMKNDRMYRIAMIICLHVQLFQDCKILNLEQDHFTLMGKVIGVLELFQKSPAIPLAMWHYPPVNLSSNLRFRSIRF